MIETFNPSCVCGGSVDRPNDDCERCRMQTALAAATKRAEEAEELAMRLQKIEIQVCKEIAGCRDLIATLRTRIAEAEQENARLREALENWRDWDTLGKLSAMRDARKLTAALLAKPKGGPDA